MTLNLDLEGFVFFLITSGCDQTSEICFVAHKNDNNIFPE